MAQRSFRSIRTGQLTIKARDLPALSATDERALTRVGHDKGAWHEIGWFIHLSRIDLDRVSQGELLSLQEEFAALRKFHLRVTADYPDIEILGELQRIVRKHLSELADQGFTYLPDIPVSQQIAYPKVIERIARGSGDRPTSQASSLPDRFSAFHTMSDMGLITVMGHLLMTVRNLIARCPHCRNIFLQSRRNQEYCTRSCQSVAVMQRLRAKTNKRISKKITRGGRHGTKRR